MRLRERYLPLVCSQKAPVRGARRLGPAPAEEAVGITVLLRGRSPDGVAATSRALAVGQLAGQAAGERRHLTRDEYAALHGADPDDIAAVEAFAARHGLAVTEVSSAKRTLKLTGTAAELGGAFQVRLTRNETATGVVYRGRTGTINVPASLAPVVEGVFGLDDRPQASPHFRLEAAPAARSARPGFLPTEVAELYRFPRDVDGSGQTIAIIELGGGFRRDDLEQYFTGIGISAPTPVAVSVDGARNAPTGDAGGPDGEVMLDIEIVGAVAPGARIAVYFAPNTSQGFLDAVLAAVHDHDRAPSVISISWGAAESDWTRQSLRAMDDAFQAGVLLGVTTCVAAGDSGSSDGVDDGASHVDFPASSPHVLACGGTRLAGSQATIEREVAWGGPKANGATGGGVSDVFPPARLAGGRERPAFAEPRRIQGARRPGRGRQRGPRNRVPDQGRRGSRADRRDERRLAAPGRARRTPQPGARTSCRLPQPARLPRRRPGPVPGRHDRDERSLPGGSWLGRVHRARVADRRRACRCGSRLTVPLRS